MICGGEILRTILISGDVTSTNNWWLDRQPRRDPLTTDLRRLPGNSLETRLEKQREKLLDLMIWALATGFVAALMILIKRLPRNGIDWQADDTLYLLIGQLLELLEHAVECGLIDDRFQTGRLATSANRVDRPHHEGHGGGQ